MWKQKWLAAVVLAVAFAVALPPVFGDDTKQDDSKTEEKTRPAKPRGRLPAYYRQVVDDSQRLRIYTIQTKFRAESEKIEAQIEVLTRDLRAALAKIKQQETQEVAAVLSAEQLAKVEKIRAESAAKRGVKSEAKNGAKTTGTKD